MFTVCSRCSLRLTVTTADLRAAQGYVRCGRCHNVFNALASLAEETPDTTGVHRANTALPAEPPHAPERAPDPTPPPPPRATVTPAAAPAAVEPTDADLEFDLDATDDDLQNIFVTAVPARHDTGTFESIILRSGAIEDDPDDDVQLMHMPTEELAALAAAAERAARQQQSPTVPDEATQAQVAVFTAALAQTRPSSGDAPDPLADEDDSVPGRSGGWLAAACVLLAVALAAQATHHWRGALAATGPLHGPLTALYAGLGLSLAPGWDVTRYEVRQLGAEADSQSGNTLQVHAGIRNTAQRPQPLPLLRVTLEDRFGNRLAARDLTPAEYLSKTAGAAGDALLAPGAAVDATASLVDPGQNAMGFELDACLPRTAGGVMCANDQGGR